MWGCLIKELAKVTKGNNQTFTRRRVFQVGLAAVGGVVAIGGARAAEGLAGRQLAQDKIAQNLVQYQETPKDGAKCSTCVNFEAPSGCKIVAGTINPEGWCIAYAPKES
jgi:hypothetical protein